MAGNLLDLSKNLKKRSREIKKSASELSVNVALTIVGDLVYKTPVDTSKALSNWIVTLGKPSKDKLDPHFFGEFGSSQKASAAESLTRAKYILKNKKPGQSIFIVNNLPYIVRLNEGYSAQAPAGFVERAILIGRKLFSKYKTKVA